MTSRSRAASDSPSRKDTHGEPEPDAEGAQIERNLRLSYSERLDQLVRTVAFIHAGRAALARLNE